MIRFNKDFSLKAYNTFGIEAKAGYFFTIRDTDLLKDIIRSGFLKNKKHLILGGGSNVLFVNNFNGVVLHNQIKGIKKIDEDRDRVFIEAGSGEIWPEFVDFTLSKGWYGLENLSLIPGTTGAAPVQNIGAYGVEQQSRFHGLKAVHLLTGEQKEFDRNQCRFGYRQSVFKEEAGVWFIVSVVYSLLKKPAPVLHYGPLQEHFSGKKEIDPGEISQYVKEIRRAKLPDPSETGNGGSFFKNPEIDERQYRLLKSREKEMPAYPLENGRYKIPAGWLIEQCGWKGKRIGDAGVYPKQALVLVNYGNATGKEILELAEKIKKSVFERFGITLEPEVKIID